MRGRRGKEDSWVWPQLGGWNSHQQVRGMGSNRLEGRRVVFAPDKFKMLQNVQGTTGLLGQRCEVQKDRGWRCQQVQQTISDTGCDPGVTKGCTRPARGIEGLAQGHPRTRGTWCREAGEERGRGSTRPGVAHGC